MLKYFRNRRSMGWLFGSGMLVLVIFAFIAFYVPDILAPGDGVGATTGAVAWVDGDPITSREFLQGYRSQDAQYRQQLGAQYSPDLLRSSDSTTSSCSAWFKRKCSRWKRNDWG